MKKLLFGVVLLTALVGVLATTGIVYAQTQEPPAQPENGWGMGRMMRGQGRGMMGGQTGPLHTTMVSTFAEKLGMSVEDLNAALAEGKTMWQIASEQGLSSDEITTLMQEARGAALEQAVADGALTQEQADWMQEHMQQRGAGGGYGGPCWNTTTN